MTKKKDRKTDRQTESKEAKKEAHFVRASGFVFRRGEIFLFVNPSKNLFTRSKGSLGRRLGQKLLMKGHWGQKLGVKGHWGEKLLLMKRGLGVLLKGIRGRENMLVRWDLRR